MVNHYKDVEIFFFIHTWFIHSYELKAANSCTAYKADEISMTRMTWAWNQMMKEKATTTTIAICIQPQHIFMCNKYFISFHWNDFVHIFAWLEILVLTHSFLVLSLYDFLGMLLFSAVVFISFHCVLFVRSNLRSCLLWFQLLLSFFHWHFSFIFATLWDCLNCEMKSQNSEKEKRRLKMRQRKKRRKREREKESDRDRQESRGMGEQRMIS